MQETKKTKPKSYIYETLLNKQQKSNAKKTVIRTGAARNKLNRPQSRNSGKDNKVFIYDNSIDLASKGSYDRNNINSRSPGNREKLLKKGTSVEIGNNKHLHLFNSIQIPSQQVV